MLACTFLLVKRSCMLPVRVLEAVKTTDPRYDLCNLNLNQ